MIKEKAELSNIGTKKFLWSKGKMIAECNKWSSENFRRVPMFLESRSTTRIFMLSGNIQIDY